MSIVIHQVIRQIGFAEFVANLVVIDGPNFIRVWIVGASHWESYEPSIVEVRIRFDGYTRNTEFRIIKPARNAVEFVVVGRLGSGIARWSVRCLFRFSFSFDFSFFLDRS